MDNLQLKSAPKIFNLITQKSTMKIHQNKKILSLALITIANFTIPANNANAWSGYDYDNKTEIDIGPGNLVREGLVIQFYDNRSDNFHTARVLFSEEIAGGTRLQIQDLDSKKERTFIMQNSD